MYTCARLKSLTIVMSLAVFFFSISRHELCVFKTLFQHLAAAFEHESSPLFICAVIAMLL